MIIPALKDYQEIPKEQFDQFYRELNVAVEEFVKVCHALIELIAETADYDPTDYQN